MKIMTTTRTNRQHAGSRSSGWYSLGLLLSLVLLLVLWFDVGVSAADTTTSSTSSGLLEHDHGDHSAPLENHHRQFPPHTHQGHAMYKRNNLPYKQEQNVSNESPTVPVSLIATPTMASTATEKDGTSRVVTKEKLQEEDEEETNFLSKLLDRFLQGGDVVEVGEREKEEKPTVDPGGGSPGVDDPDRESGITNTVEKDTTADVVLDGDTAANFDAVCTKPNDDFQSAIGIAYKGTAPPMLTEEQVALLETVFRDCYNAQTVSGVNTCDNKFRSIANVQTVRDAKFTGAVEGEILQTLTTNRRGRRRRRSRRMFVQSLEEEEQQETTRTSKLWKIQEQISGTELPVTTSRGGDATDFVDESIITTARSSSKVRTHQDDDGSLPVPTMKRRRRIQIQQQGRNPVSGLNGLLLINAGGPCRKCPNEKNLFDDTSKRRRQEQDVQEYEQQEQEQKEGRNLQGDDDCTCPQEATEARADLFLEALNAKIKELRTAGTNDFLESISELIAIEGRTCPSEKKIIPTRFAFTQAVITSRELEALGESAEIQAATLFRDSYNGIAQTLCDPFYRSISKVEFVSIVDEEDDLQSTIEFDVEFDCYDDQCETSCLFDEGDGCGEGGGRLRLLNQQQQRRTSMLDPHQDIIHTLSNGSTSPQSMDQSHTSSNSGSTTRFLQTEAPQEQEEQCYCRAVADEFKRPPKEMEFRTSYEESLTTISECFETTGSDMEALYDFCRDFDEEDQCCFDGTTVGPGACSDWNVGTVVCKGSCRGENSCNNVAGGSGIEPLVTIGFGSCIGTEACFNIGFESNLVFVADGSCDGDTSCLNVGLQSGSVTIAQESCVGVASCANLGELSAGNIELGLVETSRGSIVVGANSCTAESACFNLGNAAEFVSVGDDTCTTPFSCSECLYRETSPVSIPDNAEFCVDDNASCQTDITTGTVTCTCNIGFEKLEGELCKPTDCLQTIEPLNMTQVYAFCDAHSDEDKCCLGLFACTNWTATSTYRVCRGSCVGENACDNIGGSGNGEISLGIGACVGEEACQDLGMDAAEVSVEDESCVGPGSCFKLGPNAKDVEIGTESCVGMSPCKFVGMKTTGKIKIGKQSCNDENACSDFAGLTESGDIRIGKKSCIGSSACVKVGNEANQATIGDDSCHGEGSCYFVGCETNSKVIVGKDSCLGDGACTQVGLQSSNDVIIEDKCCDGVEACYDLGYQSDEVTILKASCIGEEACFTVGPLANSVIVGEESCVGDGACTWVGENSLEDVVIGANSCQGNDACYDLGWQNTGLVTIAESSCIGLEACYAVGAESSVSVTIATMSCIGEYACQYAGFSSETITIAEGSCLGIEACFVVGPEAPTTTIGAETCIGDYACTWVGERAESEVSIGDMSCVGFFACYDLGWTALETVTIDMHSCIGIEACKDLGAEGASNLVTVGSKSCLEDYACTWLGQLSSNNVIVGNDACQGLDACYDVGWDSDQVFIGPGSCLEEASCKYAGSRSGSISIDTMSCIGLSACQWAGWSSEEATIGESSCIGEEACYVIGGVSNSVTVGSESCIEDFSCQWVGENSEGHVAVGDKSCLGVDACSDLGWNCITCDLTVEDASCIDEDSCFAAGAFAGSVFIATGSCRGDTACQWAGYAAETLTIDEGSCIGVEACFGFGDESEGSTVSVGSSACLGDYACNWVGEFAEVEASVGDRSCVGESACFDLGWKATDVVMVGQDSCRGEEACNEVAGSRSEPTLVTIGDNSCREDYACTWVGEDAFDFIMIGDTSCRGEEACYDVGYDADRVSIGDNSCIGIEACYAIAPFARTVSIGNSNCLGDGECFEDGIEICDDVPAMDDEPDVIECEEDFILADNLLRCCEFVGIPFVGDTQQAVCNGFCQCCDDLCEAFTANSCSSVDCCVAVNFDFGNSRDDVCDGVCRCCNAACSVATADYCS